MQLDKSKEGRESGAWLGSAGAGGWMCPVAWMGSDAGWSLLLRLGVWWGAKGMGHFGLSLRSRWLGAVCWDTAVDAAPALLF